MTPLAGPHDSRREIGFRIFRGRRLGPLVGPWLSSAIFAALTYYVERTMPALHDLAGLVYWLLLAIVMIATWRWFRVRSTNRRASDRRRPTRQEESDRSPD